MIKRIFWLSPAIIAGVIGLVHLLHGIAEAGTYKLEYPANYGCKCTPNVWGYGYFRTEWRQSPGEERLDQKHPRVIGSQPLPPVKGYEQLPLPRVKLQDLQPPPEAEKPLPPPNELPGEPAVPGGEGLPPGLPPDFQPETLGQPEKQPSPQDTPSPLENKDTPPPSEKKDTPPVEPPKDQKDDAKPAVGGLKFKSESPKKIVSNQPTLNRHAETSGLKSSVPTRLPDTAPATPAAENSQAMNQAHPQANWNSALQPGIYPETFRSGTIYPATDMARQADYQAPAESSGSGVVEQSFQQTQSSAGKPAPAMPADSRKRAAPPIALKGYCPVELCRGGRWVQGDPRWTVIHHGVTYRLSGNDQRMRFLANPEQFAPANGGNDLVISVNQRRNVPGELSYCAAFKERIYMFSSSATQLEFQKNPERFIGAQDQNANSSTSSDSTLGIHEFQTLGRSYNTARTGF